MLMFLSMLEATFAFQMTVSTTHSLNMEGIKVVLRYFDSLCRELVNKQKVPTITIFVRCRASRQLCEVLETSVTLYGQGWYQDRRRGAL
jgi:hypothetical protein